MGISTGTREGSIICLTNKLFVPFITSIFLPFFSIAGNIPVEKLLGNRIQVFGDHRVLSIMAGRMPPAGDYDNGY